jgi:hypothetical protein
MKQFVDPQNAVKPKPAAASVRGVWLATTSGKAFASEGC